MRALLDVNVLIALLDVDHVHHVQARTWLSANVRTGWASCPITQNGCVRVMSQPNYPGARPIGAVIERLAAATATREHAFWPNDLSILDPERIDHGRLHGPRQVTDLYLLALAVQNGGRFASFDRALPISAVRGAKAKHLVLI